ncbi:MAG: 30S ribosome-binding factor RbfA [Longimicrobiales bacterium]
MSGRRVARLNEQLKREISGILRREVHDPRIGAPTVTGVEVTPDLWMARVYVRPGPGSSPDEEGSALLEGLEAASSYIRRELGEALTVRRVPELRFELDRTLERAMRIEEILRDVLPEDEGTAPEPEDEDPGDAEEDPGARGERDQARNGEARE